MLRKFRWLTTILSTVAAVALAAGCSEPDELTAGPAAAADTEPADTTAKAGIDAQSAGTDATMLDDAKVILDALPQSDVADLSDVADPSDSADLNDSAEPADVGAIDADDIATDIGLKDVNAIEIAAQDDAKSEVSTADAVTASDAAVAGPDPKVYAPDYMPKFQLVVGKDAMAVLMDSSDASKKTWVHAAFTCEGETIADVGLRRKGESTFRAVPQKAAFKIRFNKWQPGQKWRGYKDLTLNNMVDDATGLRERLGYTFYNLMGLPAPKCNTALVTLNGEAYGPYANLETPDEQFLAAHFGAKSSTLYEVDWGSEWLPGSEDGFTVDVGDGKKTDLLAFFDAVEAAKDDKLLTDMAKHLDIEQWLTFCAIEAVIAEHDNYAFAVWGSHNYYMSGGADGRFRLIPWSVDLSFTDSDGGVDASKPLSADPTDGGETLLQRCKSTATCWNQYKAHVATALTGLQTTNLAALATQWHNQIDVYQASDTKRESSLTYYKQSVPEMFTWIAKRAVAVKGQLGLP